MANDIVLEVATPIVIADTTDYTDNCGFGARTHQIDLTSLAAGAARQSEDFDFLTLVTNSRAAPLYRAAVSVEFASAPTSGERVDFYLGFGHTTTSGTFPGGLAATDAGYDGTPSDSMDDSLKQLTFIGSLIATSDAQPVIQIQDIGFFVPEARYACLVVDNNTSQALDSDATNMAIRIEPMFSELQ